MRKALTILACALALLAACEKPDSGNPSKPTPTPPTPPPTPAAPIVVAAGTDLKPTITSDGGDTKISFTAKESWTASVIETKSVDWISLDKTSGGTGDFTLTVTVKPNTTYDDRSATVQIKSGSTTIDILFSQKQTDALIVAVSEIKVGAEGDTIEIEVETNVNVSYKIESDGEGWISFVSTKALTTKVFTFAVAANETSSLREGTITLSGGSFTHQVKVTQDAPSILNINKKEFAFDSKGGDFSVEVSSTLDVTYSIGDDCSSWIRLKTTKSLSTTTLTFEVDANNSFEERKGTIKIIGGELEETITITQDAPSILNINKKEFAFDSKGRDFSVEVSSTLDVTYSIGDDCSSWIRLKTTKSLSTTTLTFEVDANNSFEERKGTIKIIGGELEETITITQDASVPTLSVSQNEFEVGPGESQIKVEVTSNVPVYIQTEDYWVWFIGNDSSAPYVYLFGISRNNAYESRSCNITFYNDEFGLREVVTVTQKPSDIVRFYDQNFKDFCLKNFDTDGNGEISFDEAKAVKEIDYQAKTIDLYGLEAFVNLETLKIGSGVTDIEIARNECRLWNANTISSLTKLRHLECTYVYISNLDISGLPDLEYLNVEGTALSQLDVSNNKKLTYLDCAPQIYENLQYLSICKGQTIPNVTENRSDDYIPPYTQIYVDGTATGGGNEGTMEGGEI